MDETLLVQIPRYRCHKEVHALRILQVDELAGHLVPDAGFPPIPVSAAWLERNKPQTGGYWVRYEDGFESYSPAAPFESGYSYIEAINVGPKEVPGGF